MRFLHLADAHLDTSFAGRSRELRERLREASREALRRAVDLALDEHLDAVLIAGDLFDDDRLSFATERFLGEQFGRLREARIPVVYATGNHDPGRSGHRAQRIPWPENVTAVRDGTPVRLEVRGRGGAVIGAVTAAGHAAPGETDDLSRRFTPAGGSVPEVALLHTQVRGSAAAEDHHPYAPSELDRLQRAGYHYWALGHVHLRQCLSEDPPIHYPGNLQGRTHRESGAKGALVVDLRDRDRPAAAFHELAPARWETVVVDDLQDVVHLDALVERVAGAWERQRRAAAAAEGTEWLLRVRLRGATPLWAELSRSEDVSTLAGELRGRIGALDVEVQPRGVHPPVSADERRARTDVLGEALRLLDEVRDGSARLDVDASRLAGRPPDGELDRYLRRLLDDAEGDLLTRMIRPEEP